MSIRSITAHGGSQAGYVPGDIVFLAGQDFASEVLEVTEGSDEIVVRNVSTDEMFSAKDSEVIR